MMNEREEVIYDYMREALDGELSDAGWTALESHLRARPDLAREWQALQAIDQLLRSTPALRPAADFAQRTMARLPNRRARLWFVAALYLLFLVSGLVPLVLLVWLMTALLPTVLQPALVRVVLQAAGELLSVAGLALRALFNGAIYYVQQQPAVLGWPLVMLGVIFLWAGIYRQLISGPVNGNAQ